MPLASGCLLTTCSSSCLILLGDKLLIDVWPSRSNPYSSFIASTIHLKTQRHTCHRNVNVDVTRYSAMSHVWQCNVTCVQVQCHTWQFSVTCDSAMSHVLQVNVTRVTVQCHTRTHSHIRASLTDDMANTVAVSMVHSRLDNASFVIHGQTNVKILPSVQNSVAGVVLKHSTNLSSCELLLKLHWLPSESCSRRVTLVSY